MNDLYPCDIIRDLLPGYIDHILSDAGTQAVKKHLETCGQCRAVCEKMADELSTEAIPEDLEALNGFKKINRRAKRLKAALVASAGLLAALLFLAFLTLFVIGRPVSTHLIDISSLSYDEDNDSLTLEGTIHSSGLYVGRAVWEQSEEDANSVNILIYGVYSLPFRHKSDFTITVPDMKGKKAYLACPKYDQLELYSWKNDHYELLSPLEDEIYRSVPSLDRDRDILYYTGGVQEMDGLEGILYDVEHLTGENPSLWRFNDQLITDGSLEPAGFSIWISLSEPHKILLCNYETGEWTTVN